VRAAVDALTILAIRNYTLYLAPTEVISMVLILGEDARHFCPQPVGLLLGVQKRLDGMQ
jgi:hypothetical protein